MLPTSAGVEPATFWSPVGRRIQLSHRDRQFSILNTLFPVIILIVGTRRCSSQGIGGTYLAGNAVPIEPFVFRRFLLSGGLTVFSLQDMFWGTINDNDREINNLRLT